MAAGGKGTVLLYTVTKEKLREVKDFMTEQNGGKPATYDDAVDFLYRLWKEGKKE